MTDPGGKSEAEGEIFLQALQLYSASCETPHLIEDCPFSVDLDTHGNRGCGEECLEILAKHGRRAGLESSAIKGTELAVERKGSRPPRNPIDMGEESRAFDAAEVYYRESDKGSIATWHTCALIYRVRDVVRTVLDERTPDANEDLVQALRVLAERGIATDPLLRYGLGIDLAFGLANSVWVSEIQETGGPSSLMTQGWISVRDELRAEYDPSPHEYTVELAPILGDGDTVDLNGDVAEMISFTLTGPFMPLLTRWVLSADVDDLVGAIPPASIASIPEAAEAVLGSETARTYRWIVDRYIQTYTDEWHSDSIRLEYGYQKGAVVAPFSQSERTLRRFDLAELAIRIADAATESRDDELHVYKISEQALRLLLQGHRRAATALLRVQEQEFADNGDFHNNLGFCLLPDDPVAAMVSLQKAHALGYEDTVNLANRMLALMWSDRSAAALAMASDAFDDWDSLTSRSSYLWDYEAPKSETRLLSRVCPRCYVARLALHLAESMGDSKEQTRWQSLIRHRNVDRPQA